MYGETQKTSVRPFKKKKFGGGGSRGYNVKKLQVGVLFILFENHSLQCIVPYGAFNPKLESVQNSATIESKNRRQIKVRVF